MNPPAPPAPVGMMPPPIPRPAGAPPAPPTPQVPQVPPTPPLAPPAEPSVRLMSSLPQMPPNMASRAIISAAQEECGNERDERAPLPPGTVLGRYTITARLGRGGYGLTYRARHTVKGNAVVIKEHMPIGMALREVGSSEVTFPSNRAEERFHATMAEFLEEITILRALSYPGIVPIIDSFEANDTAYYVMPLIAGVTLQPPEKITLDPRRQRLQAQRTKRLLHSLLYTLEYMEQHNIVHRDIKPDNILISTEGVPVLLDFGSARQLHAGKVFTNVFTPDFCAPEQATAISDEEMSRALSPRTDLYSLGATFYSLITRLVPPSAEMRTYSTPDPYKPLATRPELTEAYGTDFLAAIDRAMELNPADRWASATEWRESLENDTHEISPKLMRNIRIFGGLAVAALVLVGSLAVYAFSERNQVRAAYNSGLNFTESLLYDFSTELTDIPGSTDLQRHLSANLQKYLTSMRDLPIGQDGRLDRSMAAAWFNIGCMHMSLGNMKGAREALQRARELMGLICTKEPDDQRYRYELARVCLAQAELDNRCNLSADSSAHAEVAVDILQQLHTLYPDNPNYGSSLGEALAFETFHLRKQGNHEARKIVLDKLLTLYQDLVTRFPRHLSSASGLGYAMHYRGRYAKDIGDYETAGKYLSESRKIFTRLTTNYPYRLSFKKGLSELLHTAGDMYYYQSLSAKDEETKAKYAKRADDALREHIALVQELRRLDDDNLTYLLLECRAQAQVGNILLLHGDVNEAEAHMRMILENAETLLRKEPNNYDYISTKAQALCSLALAHHNMPRNRAKAGDELAACRKLLDKSLAGLNPPPDVLLSAQIEALTHSAAIAIENGEKKQAGKWLQQADKMLTSLISDNAPTPRQKVYMALIRRHMEQLHADDAAQQDK